MRYIILIFVLIPYFSWSMDDTEFSSVTSDDMVCEKTYQRVEENDPNDQPVIANISPRSTRSNSYVQTFNDVLRRSREMRVEGLEELEEGIVGTPRNLLTQEQIAQYFFTSMEGQNIPGFGLFNREDEDQCASLRGLISIIKRIDPERYNGMIRAITHHRSRRYPNTALIEVLGKVVTSINALNADSTHIAEQQLEQMREQVGVMQNQLNLAQQFNANMTRRFRLTTIWTIVGGVLAVIATNLLQAYAGQIEAALNPMDSSTMIQNTTMS